MAVSRERQVTGSQPSSSCTNLDMLSDLKMKLRFPNCRPNYQSAMNYAYWPQLRTRYSNVGACAK